MWSFWSKPFTVERHTSWASELHHWLAWGLSVETARRHYPQTCLVTDDAGARILIDDLQLPFTSVIIGLDRLRDADPEWWALGKLEAYRRQPEPFVHVDTDVFLWNALPTNVASAPVFAQNPEPIPQGESCYRPRELEEALTSSGWLPREWLWYRKQTAEQRAECCGIFGGCDLEFIQKYAAKALRLALDPRNRGLANLHGRIGHMILLEQYLLTACLEYRGVRIEYLFESMADAYQPGRAAELGYTHLAAGAKRNPRIARELERRVASDLPRHYERCLRYMSRQPLFSAVA
ncbi:MAG: DUF6734 family protein [Bryobacteraceae bacterium]